MNKTFNEKLAEHLAISKEQSYKKKCMPEVKAYNLEYRKVSGKYPYNQAIEDYILSKEQVSPELIDHLGMEIYLSQKDIREDEDNSYKDKMLADGWLELNNNVIYRGKVEYIAQKTNDWLTSKLANIGRIQETNDGKDLFLIPKGNRTRGYYVRNLEKAFYKPLTK